MVRYNGGNSLSAIWRDTWSSSIISFVQIACEQCRHLAGSLCHNITTCLYSVKCASFCLLPLFTDHDSSSFNYNSVKKKKVTWPVTKGINLLMDFRTIQVSYSKCPAPEIWVRSFNKLIIKASWVVSKLNNLRLLSWVNLPYNSFTWSKVVKRQSLELQRSKLDGHSAPLCLPFKGFLGSVHLPGSKSNKF